MRGSPYLAERISSRVGVLPVLLPSLLLSFFFEPLHLGAIKKYHFEAADPIYNIQSAIFNNCIDSLPRYSKAFSGFSQRHVGPFLHIYKYKPTIDACQQKNASGRALLNIKRVLQVSKRPAGRTGLAEWKWNRGFFSLLLPYRHH